MLPDPAGQHQVIKKAYLRAGLETDQTDYVEAHGTGTAVGDPIEVEAISDTFTHKSGRSTLIGSVKTNLGHSEAMSGIASVIKVILALEHRMIPPTINIKKINPKVACRKNVTVVQDLTPWPKSDCPRASINSFGFGGANSHAILEDAGTPAWTSQLSSLSREKKRLMLLPISASTSASLTKRLEDLKKLLGQPGLDIPLGCTAYTLAERRTHFAKRGYMLVDEGVHGDAHSTRKTISLETSSSQHRKPVAFLFTGQGAHWQGMGIELFHRFELFRNTIIYLSAALRCEPSPGDLLSLLLARDGSIDDPWVAQVLTTAVQIAIFDLLRHFGIVPSVVVGHSSGELAAAYAANLLSATEAIICSNARGRTVSNNLAKLPHGTMLAAGLTAKAALAWIDRLQIAEEVCIACINSPVNVTISGTSTAIKILQKSLDQESIFNRRLKTGGAAYHSPMMRAIGCEYRQLVDRALRQERQSRTEGEHACMISTVNGKVMTANDARTAKYWQDNLEGTVHFDTAVVSLLQRGPHHVIEIGPHCALKTPFHDIQQSTISEGSVEISSYDSVLVRQRDAQETLLDLMGNLYGYGLDVRFEHVNQIETVERHVETRLPRYPWDYSKGLLWREPRAIAELRSRQYRRHELLGSIVTGGNHSTFLWRNVFSIDDSKWVQDHRFGPTVLFPAAGFLSMAIEAICQVCGRTPSTTSALTLRDIRFLKALPLADSSPVELFTELKRLPISAVELSTEWWQFSIGSFQQQIYTAHMGGLIRVNEVVNEITPESLSVTTAALEERNPQPWFKRLQSIGLNLGPAFMTFQKIWVDRNRILPEAMAQVRFSRGEKDEATGLHDYIVHPTTLDSLLQSAFIAAAAGEIRRADPWIPVAIGELHVTAPERIDMCTIEPWRTQSTAKVTGFGTIVGNSDLRNVHGEILMRMRNARAVIYQGIHRPDHDLDEARFPMLRVCWKPEVANADEMTAKAIESHVDIFKLPDIKSQGNTEIAAFLDLACHKQPESRILSIGPDVEFETISTTVLSSKSSYRRFGTWHHSSIDSNGNLGHSQPIPGIDDNVGGAVGLDISDGSQQYDIVIANSVSTPGAVASCTI